MELDAFQQAAAFDPSERLLIEAPAGSGKTRVLVERAAWLVAQRHVRAQDVLVLTFARRAALELRERLAARGLGEVNAQTFHAWAFRLLRSIHTSAFRLVSDVEREVLLRRLLVRLVRDPRHGAVFRQLVATRNWSPTFAARELLTMLGTLRSFGRTVDDVRSQLDAAADRDLNAVLLTLWRSYEALLERNDAFDFPMLVRRATAALRAWPVRTRSPTTHLRHVLIDESQDASPDELALLTAAARAATTWVGDPNQSIYAWRGAARLDGATLQQRPLRCCYRSDGRIVSLVNGYLRRAVGRGAHVALPVRSSVVRPVLVRHARYGEAAALAHVLAQLSAQGLRPSDVMVLARCHAPLERLRTTCPRGVRLTTVHAAKGLEAHAVVVVGVSDDRFGFPLPERTSPYELVRRLATYDQVAEERRLFYVALTRARDHLVLLSDAERPSSLLEALPARTYRRATIPSTKP